MRKGKLMNSLFMVLAFLTYTGVIYAQEFEFEDERQLAKDVFKSLQDGDVELFSSYCISEERMAKMLDEMGNETEMEKGIKSELIEIPASELRDETVSAFESALERAKNDTVDLKEGEYPELAFYKTRFEVTNLKCVKVKADISTDKKYMMIISLFKSPEDIFIYDFDLVKGGLY